MDREAAQARLNRVRTFTAELTTLEQAGTLTLAPEQRRAISDYHRQLLTDLTARFDLDRDEGQQRMSLGMRIASIMGALALSAAVFLLFYRIWVPPVLSHLGAAGDHRPGRPPHRRATRVGGGH